MLTVPLVPPMWDDSQYNNCVVLKRLPHLLCIDANGLKKRGTHVLFFFFLGRNVVSLL